MRITTHGFFRICDTYCCEKLQHTCFCLFFVHICMTADQLHHLTSYCIDRIQGRKGILKDHGDMISNIAAQTAVHLAGNRLAVKEYFALLIIILVFKPTGLFGEKATDKV